VNVAQVRLACMAAIVGALIALGPESEEQPAERPLVAWAVFSISSHAPPSPALPPGHVSAMPIGPVTPLAPLPDLSVVPDFANLEPDYASKERLTRDEAGDVLRLAGVPVEWWEDFLALGWCESEYQTGIIGDRGDSYGWLQIQPYAGGRHLWRLGVLGYPLDPDLLLDPVINAEVGAHIRATNGNYGAWSCQP